MTPDEEYEYLSLKKKQARSAPTKAVQPEPTIEDRLSVETERVRQEDWEGMPWHEKALIGAGEGVEELRQGMSDLTGIGEISEQARDDLASSKEMESGWKTGGKIAGEIAQMALPAGPLTKAARGLSKVPMLGKLGGPRLSRALGEATAAAGVGYAKAPGEGESRSKNAALNAAGALGGELGAKVLSKTLAGANRSKAGQRLLDKGIDLTPGQAADSPVYRGLEAVAEVTPFLAKGTKKAQARVAKEINEEVFDAAAPLGKKVTETGTAGVSQLKGQFKEAYKEAWSGATSITDKAKDKFLSIANKAAPRLSKKQLKQLVPVMDDFKKLTKDITPKKFLSLDNELRKSITAAGTKNPQLTETLTAMRKALRKGAPKGVASKLKAVDGQYGKFLTVRRAAKNAAGEGGEFEPKNLVQAMKAIGKDRAGEGTAPMQEMITDIAQTAGKKEGGAPLEWFRRVAGLPPTPVPQGVMRKAGQAVLGQTATQGGLRKALGALPASIKRPGLVGAGLTTDDEERKY